MPNSIYMGSKPYWHTWYEIADNLAKATSNTILPSLVQLPLTDFIPILRRNIVSHK